MTIAFWSGRRHLVGQSVWEYALTNAWRLTGTSGKEKERDEN